MAELAGPNPAGPKTAVLFSRGSRAGHGICFPPQAWVRWVRRPHLSSTSGPGLQSEQRRTRVVRWVVDFPGWCPPIAVRGWRWSGFLPCSGPDSPHRPCREPTAVSRPGRGLLRGGGGGLAPGDWEVRAPPVLSGPAAVQFPEGRYPPPRLDGPHELREDACPHVMERFPHFLSKPHSRALSAHVSVSNFRELRFT